MPEDCCIPELDQVVRREFQPITVSLRALREVDVHCRHARTLVTNGRLSTDVTAPIHIIHLTVPHLDTSTFLCVRFQTRFKVCLLYLSALF